MAGTILMRVYNKTTYLLALAHVFKNQMHLGKRILTLCVKHKNGERVWERGCVDTIFKSKMLQQLEYGDLILLEHGSDLTELSPHTFYSKALPYDNDLKVVASEWGDGCHIVPQNDSYMTYFVIKNHPMAQYRVKGNEVISDLILGTTATIMNNCYGRMNNYRSIESISIK